MAEVLATMVVGPLLSMVKEKASSTLLDQYKVMEGMEQQHKLLKRKLPAILDVITDAEEQAAAKREGAKAWLDEVRLVAYKANDILDEFKYEALRRKAKKEGHYKELGMDVIKLRPSHNRFVFRYRMANKLRMILQEIDVLITEMNTFRFKFKPGRPQSTSYLRLNSSDIFDPKDIASRSRANEKEVAVCTLLAQIGNENLTVYPIIGMPGLGKTTLAQLIYNDPKIQKHFELRLWVCVSNHFDVDSLADRIVKENGCKASGNSVLDRLQDAVKGKRYILVLDDVWNRDASKWEKLKSYLQHGGPGSSVLTTTRDEAVAKLMGPTEKGCELGSLGAEFIEEIIKTKAFSSKQDEWPSGLVEMVSEVARRCAGSPMAATALGSVLGTKTNKEEWEAILNRRTICDEENGILPVLNLSYNCLPPYMRQCFAFCAMFPKDYEIDMQMLIQLWMANGFIPEQQGVCLETTGENFFNELKSRSFFQDLDGVSFDEKSSIFGGSKCRYCKIHDLMHDIALSAMGKECAAIATDLSKSKDVLHYSARHMYLSVRQPETFLNASIEKGSPVFQTLICDGYVKEDLKLLSKYNSIRALKINRGSILKPKYLHHLRYLDLSKSYIQALPEDITILYHLQTLNLSGCIYLRRLPKRMKYMTALRHLYCHGCGKLESMPADLSHLTSLQTLTCFAAGTTSSDCSGAKELQSLDLGGHLELSRLENVTEEDAKETNLADKKKLTELTLRWTNATRGEQKSDEKVLEGLQPHDGLKVLRIYFFQSSACPTWINKLEAMVELQLSDCKEIKELPPLWKLPALQVLRFYRLDSLHCLCSGDAPFEFQRLKELTLSEMPNFQRWAYGLNEVHIHEAQLIIFPLLEKLSIWMCERLTALPNLSGYNVWHSAFPVLQVLELNDVGTHQKSVVGSLLSMVKNKAISCLLDPCQVMDGMEEKHEVLERKLLDILDVITDAEEQAAAKREGAKAWLEKVRRVAYKANDVLDEFKYEALRRKAKEEGHYKTLQMDVIKLFPSHNLTVFRYRMANKLHMILQEIDVLIAEMNYFGFKIKPAMAMLWRHRDACIPINYVNIASRSRIQEKLKLVAILLDQASSMYFTVLSIVGMGGLGKTTLAQLIYNDPTIQEHFELRLWVCVSDHFDVDSLADRIVKENGCKASGNSALDRLQDAVKGKRYLLILDDVWNRDASKWEKLMSYLQHGGPGSSVLTTTRDDKVAQLMGTIVPYNISCLNDTFIKEIIESQAFGSERVENRPRELVDMVDDIVKRCCGSPLAATAFGSILRTKNSKEEWDVVLSETTIFDEEIGILPVLMLSYDVLPSHMKQCFAFCAIFPKDYEIDVEMLIQLWMANGFIPEQEGVHPELYGKQIFNYLASISFFHDLKSVPFDKEYFGVSKHKYCSRITCKIHNLMHDIALSVMGTECATVTHPGEKVCSSLGPSHVFVSPTGNLLNDSLENEFPALQTLICDGYITEDMKLLSKYNYIRALKINRGSFLRPKYLHHLRYLDLSRSDMKALPEDISSLYHLQTLNLSYCGYLEQLPKDMKYLTLLRHLYTHGCGMLKSMPADLGRLTSLQTLTYFVAGTNSGCSNVGELENFDLGSKLELGQLENVTGADAQEAGLGNKKKLTELELRWTDSEQETQSNKDNEVVEGLKPHDGLKVLRIYFCGVSTFPKWISTLYDMVELELCGCKKLEKLPALWELPALQILRLEGLESLHCLCSGGTAPISFPKLKVLYMIGMAKFEAWWDRDEVQEEELIFPMVEELEIRGCGRLTALPKAWSLITESSSGVVETKCRSAFPALRSMKLSDLNAFDRWEAVEGTLEGEVTFPRLEELYISNCGSLSALPKGSLVKQSFGRTELVCRYSAFPALRKLDLYGLSALERWGAVGGTPGEEVVIFPLLEELTVRECPKLTDRPEAPKLGVMPRGGTSRCPS